MNRQEITGAAALAAVYVLRMLGLFMLMPVLALLAPQMPDYSPLLLGLAIGGYGLSQAALQIPMGMLSDRLGRKPVILLGLSVFALGSLLAAQADTLLGVTLGRILQGAGAIAGAVMALAGDISRESQRPKVMAIIGIAIGFSFYLALLIGPVLAERWGLSGLFATTAVLALLCLPLVAFVVPTPINSAPSRDTLPNLHDLGAIGKDASLWRLNLSVFLLHALISALFVNLPRQFAAQDWPLGSHWQLYLLILVSSVVLMALVMRLGKTVAMGWLLGSNIVLMGLALLGLGLGPAQLPFLLACSVLFFAGFNYLEANFPALVSSLAPAARRGTAMGLYASCQFLGAFAGAALAGSLSAQLSAAQLYSAGAAICFLWLGLFRGFDSRPRAKRVTLKVTRHGGNLRDMRQALTDLDGVQELEWVADEQTLYLKVDGQQFDLALAKQIVGGINE